MRQHLARYEALTDPTDLGARFLTGNCTRSSVEVVRTADRVSSTARLLQDSAMLCTLRAVHSYEMYFAAQCVRICLVASFGQIVGQSGCALRKERRPEPWFRSLLGGACSCHGSPSGLLVLKAESRWPHVKARYVDASKRASPGIAFWY